MTNIPLLNNGLRPASDVCTCGVGWDGAVHLPGCRYDGMKLIICTTGPKEKPKAILAPDGKPANLRQHKKPRKGRCSPATPPYWLVLNFWFTRAVKVALWKTIKAPPGWRKCPYKPGFHGVRFQCDDLKYALTPDQVEELNAKLYLILELV